MVANGFGVAAMIRVGNQKGLRRYKDLRSIAVSIFGLEFLIAAFFGLVFVFFNTWLPKIYLDVDDIKNMADNTEVIRIASKLLWIAALFQISDGIQVVVLGALRGLQDVKIPTVITFVAYWVVGFPISWYLGLHTDYKSSGIWLGLLAGLTTSAILLYARFMLLTKNMIVNAKK